MKDSSSHVNSLNIKSIEATFFRDGLFLKEILESYLATYQECLQNMREGIRAHDGATLSKASHKLKGSTMNFSQSLITQKLEQLESAGKKEFLSEALESQVAILEVEIHELFLQLNQLADQWISESHA